MSKLANAISEGYVSYVQPLLAYEIEGSSQKPDTYSTHYTVVYAELKSDCANAEVTKISGGNLRPGEAHSGQLSYRDEIEYCTLTYSSFNCHTFQKANNKGPDQTVRMRRLVCACVVCMPTKSGFFCKIHAIILCKQILPMIVSIKIQTAKMKSNAH